MRQSITRRNDKAREFVAADGYVGMFEDAPAPTAEDLGSVAERVFRREAEVQIERAWEHANGCGARIRFALERHGGPRRLQSHGVSR